MIFHQSPVCTFCNSLGWHWSFYLLFTCFIAKIRSYAIFISQQRLATK